MSSFTSKQSLMKRSKAWTKSSSSCKSPHLNLRLIRLDSAGASAETRRLLPSHLPRPRGVKHTIAAACPVRRNTLLNIGQRQFAG